MPVNKDLQIEALRSEIEELRKTVTSLTTTVSDLTSKLDEGQARVPVKVESGMYSVSEDVRNCIEHDASWSRLVDLVDSADKGLTAAELARRWGKSRSRTSEVLNRLVEEGHLVKYRDGRRIKFRATDD